MFGRSTANEIGCDRGTLLLSPYFTKIDFRGGMRKLFSDYLSLNISAICKDVLVGYFLLLIGIAGRALGVRAEVSRTMLVALGAFPFTVVVVGLVDMMIALIIGWTLARGAGLPMREYLESPQYEFIGKQQLRRGMR